MDRSRVGIRLEDRHIPAGLVRLTEDLLKLAAAMLADPVCKGLWSWESA